MHNILIVDDHPLMRNATRELLINIDQVGEIQTAGNGKQGIEKTGLYRPDLVIMDYHLSDMTGIEAASAILKGFPDTKILFVTGLDINPLLQKMMATKAHGAITKDADPSTIKNVVSCILSGLTVFPPIIEKTASPNEVIADLNQEEILIMKKLIRGTTYNQIAELIHMSRRTVDNYVRRIFDKLGAKNKTEAIERFVRTKYY